MTSPNVHRVTIKALSRIAIILMGKRELVDLLNLSSLCLLIVVWLFLEVPWVCLQFVIVVFPDNTHFFSLAHSCVGNPNFFRSLLCRFELHTQKVPKHFC